MGAALGSIGHPAAVGLSAAMVESLSVFFQRSVCEKWPTNFGC